MKYFFYILVLILVISNVQAQEPEDDTLIVARTIIIDGDTIPNVSIEEVIIFPRLSFKNKRQSRKYRKLVRDVKRAYPYAIYAKKKLDEMENEFLSLKSEKEKKKYIKNIEKQLMDEFGNELKKLTITQGRILLKLIDRETGETSYELLKELRGAISAVFWQTIARIFGSDLKSQYDPKGEDFLMERVVRMIETGQITLDQQVVERLKISY